MDSRHSEEERRLAKAYANYDHGWERSWSDRNPGNERIHTERRRDLAGLLSRSRLLPLAGKRILEVGCAGGHVLNSLRELGAEPRLMHGVDLRAHRIEDARRDFPDIQFSASNGAALEFETGAFDLVLFFTVFSSILDDAIAQDVAREADRVLHSGGSVLWYDFRYPNPGNRSTRPYSLAMMKQLFARYRFEVVSTTLLPPLARRLGPLTRFGYPVFNALPLLRSHYLAVLTKP